MPLRLVSAVALLAPADALCPAKQNGGTQIRPRAGLLGCINSKSVLADGPTQTRQLKSVCQSKLTDINAQSGRGSSAFISKRTVDRELCVDGLLAAIPTIST
jgi:hypothetical protein